MHTARPLAMFEEVYTYVQVFFLRDGGRLELVGVEDHLKLRGFVEGYIL